MLQLWSRRPFLSQLSFKLPWASAKGGRQLAPPLLTHHPYQKNSGMSYNINTVLRINGLLGYSPVTFLLDSGATILVVWLDTLTAEFRGQITTNGLIAPIGASENSSYHRQLSY